MSLSVAERLDAADGVIDGKYYGRRIVEATPVRSSSALALDAADGVIDGKYHGRRIVDASTALVTTTPGTRVYRSGYPTYTRSASALELDAADGVIDGRYYGRQIAEAAPARTVYASPSRRVYADRYGRRIVEATPTRTVYADAAPVVYADRYADGVIDGRFYGRRIVEAPARTVYASAAPVVYADRYDRYTAVPTTYTRSASALELDAADGVIDGRYYGRQIVEAAPARRYVTAAPVRYASDYGTRVVRSGGYYAPRVAHRGLTAAERLDAADGVIDGTYYGSRIVQ
eukprot:TRINITY_DN365_c0_g1_i1.p1 TRINITY_DN365_c0_g1~~TRINITY_DN365_c0_g1_i1.p1  ORF type:complete len:288 (-),score=44.72 TRINITY_DN365_c0_g1_i1:151-1014(-)